MSKTTLCDQSIEDLPHLNIFAYRDFSLSSGPENVPSRTETPLLSKGHVALFPNQSLKHFS